ncbi:hypothetical protein ACFVHW_04365 [Streptomyces sp. NPDC127110]|uniref:hypothetical protein n=1 Tax=Streptomyces sp. NPDC127110 TaxID=3345362 RepID=UPI00363E303B
MSNSKERGRLGDILMREFGEFTAALTEAGHDWAAVWWFGVWPPGTQLRWLHGRFLLAREMAAAAGVHIPNEEITQQQRERLAYLQMLSEKPQSPTSH